MKRIYSLTLFAFLALAAAPLTAQQRTVPLVLQPRSIELADGAHRSMGASVLPSADPTLASRLQNALETELAKVDPRARRGVQVSIIAPGLGQWNGVAGISDSATPIDSTMRFEVGSISKTFIVAGILQLVDEGKVRLDDTVGKWIDPHDNIDGAITVRQLLTHSSGIFDYFNDDPTFELIIDAYFMNPTKIWTPEEILPYVDAPNFVKGTKTRYSNTNFLLLGMIIERATGKSLAEELRRRFFTPLGLTSTYCGWEEELEGELAHGWSTGFDASDTMKQTDISSISTNAPLSIAGAAGGIVSTASDLSRWSEALYGGKVLSAEMTKAMLTFKNTTEGELGLGIFRYRYYNKLLYGHTGGIFGYSSWTFSIPRDSVSMTVLINSFHTHLDDGMRGISEALLNELYKPVSSVAGQDASTSLALEQNHPNPSSGATTIRYTIPARGHVTLEVFDAIGTRVATPVDATLEAGTHTAMVQLDGLPAGTYFYALRCGEKSVVKGMQVR